MYPHPWELAAHVRHRIAFLTDERRVCAQIDQANGGAVILLTQLRHRLGLGLIQIGQALADDDTVRGLPTASARTATWGPGS
jgi:hypothetical protein